MSFRLSGNVVGRPLAAPGDFGFVAAGAAAAAAAAVFAAGAPAAAAMVCFELDDDDGPKVGPAR
jgi:hypothetical protein